MVRVGVRDRVSGVGVREIGLGLGLGLGLKLGEETLWINYSSLGLGC